jgi:hypothetical protein
MIVPRHVVTLVTQAIVVAAEVGATPTPTATIEVFILVIIWAGSQQFLQPC